MTSDSSRDTSDSLNRPFKGRGRQYLPLLVCPIDRTPLAPAEGGAVCTADPPHHYPMEDGILRLVTDAQRAAFDAASREHEARAAAQGWESPDEEAFKRLPQTGLGGYPEDYWPQYAASTALLWRYLEAIRVRAGALPIGPMGDAAVLGAGMGWLAYALDVAGYTTLAIDADIGRRYGLGVFPIARFMRVQADPVRPPLAPGVLDLVLFQEGLARTRREEDEAAALARALEALRPGGWLAVMDAFPESLEVVEALRARLQAAGLRLMDHPKRLQWRDRLAEQLDRVLSRNGTIPLVTVAQKPE